MLRQTSDLVTFLGDDGRVVRAFGTERLGYEDDDWTGRLIFDFIAPEDQVDARRAFEEAVGGDLPRSLTIRGLHRDGSYRWHEVHPARYVQPDGRALIVTINRDVHERKLAEAATAASESRYRALVDQSPLGILVIDREMRLVSANEAYARQVGAPSIEALRGHNIMASPALDMDGLEALAARVRKGETISAALSYRSLFDKQVDVRVRVSPMADEAGEYVGAQMLFEDISESRRLEEQLRHSQKMEAMGRLAGGVAHDFNNNLTVMLGLAELLSEHPALGQEEREIAAEITRAAERSAALTGQLLSFSRRGGARLEPLDLGVVVSQLAPMLKRSLDKEVTLSCSMPQSLPPISGDALLIEQAIVNLAVNANDAMPDGGSLELSLEASAPLTTSDPKVVLTVRDSGIGMDETTRSQAFEPFFTTKENRGSGLGLSMVYSIVQQFRGQIEVASEPGVGTCFTLSFPALPIEALEAPTEAARPLPHAGHERVLVLEDQAPVRKMLCEGLRRGGYEVFEAATSDEALEQARRMGAIDLFVSDVQVPDRSGPETVEILMRNRPQLRVLYISGYSNAPNGIGGRMADGFELLPKPFTVRRLLERVRITLDAEER